MEETMESPPEQQQTVTIINESADSSTNEGAFVISDVLEDLETIMEASIINKISQWRGKRQTAQSGNLLMFTKEKSGRKLPICFKCRDKSNNVKIGSHIIIICQLYVIYSLNTSRDSCLQINCCS